MNGETSHPAVETAGSRPSQVERSPHSPRLTHSDRFSYADKSSHSDESTSSERVTHTDRLSRAARPTQLTSRSTSRPAAVQFDTTAGEYVYCCLGGLLMFLTTALCRLM